ncbi:MAG: Asp-tRNA(Asn)/Glu-tRNA(Gln) amidotransferase GatCAB subunit C [Candidatus Colwellbacteria bacterium CG10_big_fil_rev_8_21_14_0_10_42_22]|uniref:Aspartyl/glutamyl-tRNA(Asn/Gln) amidotransferase subunit C n=1 Tax=Candidatus Colwellbacteria bacterium CG10_big_fil_rev_8_21_14_0_10_42_22 TaxID=1974540 RepID=A0A2H0VG97_9BACT|nr:MAG: Asp-tRNA(Asn)/Glu-tRNA(Gln) amidotransferase GatCAB subunit C [Candidatus Colwellbacteria bacterium CG10_big_fil_rev_8_21_14_0_10_42_22]
MNFDIKKYAHLARIKLSNKEEKKFQKDLEKILDHVAELEKVDVGGVKPVTGGTNLENIFREDIVKNDNLLNPSFPEEEKGYLKVPKVFNND